MNMNEHESASMNQWAWAMNLVWSGGREELRDIFIWILVSDWSIQEESLADDALKVYTVISSWSQNQRQYYVYLTHYTLYTYPLYVCYIYKFMGTLLKLSVPHVWITYTLYVYVIGITCILHARYMCTLLRWVHCKHFTCMSHVYVFVHNLQNNIDSPCMFVSKFVVFSVNVAQWLILLVI